MKRQRGRNRGGGGDRNGGGKPQQNVNRAFDSNGPDNVKIRGHAQHVFEKYQQLARDSFSSGDRVLAENYLQHADHYFRVLRALQPQRPPSEILGRDVFASGLDIDFEDENEAFEDGSDQAGEPMEGADQGRGDRFEPRQDTRRDDRYEGRRDGYGQNGGPGRDASREGQGREGQGREGQGREGQGRENRDFQNRDYQGRDGQGRDGREAQGREGQDGRSRDVSRDPSRDYQNRDPSRDYAGREPSNRDQPYGQREGQNRDDRGRDRRPETRRDDRMRDERGREDRPRDEAFGGTRSEPAPAAEPYAASSSAPASEPAAAASLPGAQDASPLLRSEDGGVSEAPAFLQALTAAPGGEEEDGQPRRPRLRRRRVRDGEGEGGDDAAAPEAVKEA